jgi:GxxExxY protein
MEKVHWELSERVIAAIIHVHRELGPGLLESTYELCLDAELRHRGIPFERQLPISVRYRDAIIDCAYRADVVVDGKLLLELKAVDAFTGVHVAQTLTYLKLLDLDAALLVNFNSVTIASSIRRLDHRATARRF